MALAGCCTIVSHTLSRQTYPLLTTAMADELGWSHQKAGLPVTAIFFAYLIGVALMTVISGPLAPKSTLVGGLALSGLGFGVLGSLSHFAALLAGFLCSGLGSAGIWLSIPTIATKAVSPARRAMVMGYLSASMGIGMVLTGQVVRLVRQSVDDQSLWRPFWFGAAAFALTTSVFVAFLMPADETEAVASRLSLSNLRAVPGWKSLSAAFFAFGIIVATFSPFLGPKLEEDGFSRGHVSSLFSLLGLAAVGALGTGRLSDRIGRRAVLIGAMAMVGLASLLVLVGREPFVALAIGIYGLASFTVPVLVATTIRDHVSD
ncbi:MAG: MFS transporter, partial [Actinomycetota bacterium]|nr:MFS transporter [Actinomycetota bacterium]